MGYLKEYTNQNTVIQKFKKVSNGYCIKGGGYGIVKMFLPSNKHTMELWEIIEDLKDSVPEDACCVECGAILVQDNIAEDFAPIFSMYCPLCDE